VFERHPAKARLHWFGSTPKIPLELSASSARRWRGSDVRYQSAAEMRADLKRLKRVRVRRVSGATPPAPGIRRAKAAVLDRGSAR